MLFLVSSKEKQVLFQVDSEVNQVLGVQGATTDSYLDYLLACVSKYFHLQLEFLRWEGPLMLFKEMGQQGQGRRERKKEREKERKIKRYLS